MYFREHSNPLRHADIHSAQLCDLCTSKKKLLSYICRAVGRSKIWGRGIQVFLNDKVLLLFQPKSGGRAIVPPLCVEMGFTWTFPSNQNAKEKLKSQLISIKF